MYIHTYIHMYMCMIRVVVAGAVVTKAAFSRHG